MEDNWVLAVRLPVLEKAQLMMPMQESWGGMVQVNWDQSARCSVCSPGPEGLGVWQRTLGRVVNRCHAGDSSERVWLNANWEAGTVQCHPYYWSCAHTNRVTHTQHACAHARGTKPLLMTAFKNRDIRIKRSRAEKALKLRLLRQ